MNNQFKVNFFVNGKKLEKLTIMVIDVTTNIHDKNEAFLTIELSPCMAAELNTIQTSTFDMKIESLMYDPCFPDETIQSPMETFTNCKVTHSYWTRSYLQNSAPIKAYLSIEAKKYNIQ